MFDQLTAESKNNSSSSSSSSSSSYSGGNSKPSAKTDSTEKWHHKPNAWHNPDLYRPTPESVDSRSGKFTVPRSLAELVTGKKMDNNNNNSNSSGFRIAPRSPTFGTKKQLIGDVRGFRSAHHRKKSTQFKFEAHVEGGDTLLNNKRRGRKKFDNKSSFDKTRCCAHRKCCKKPEVVRFPRSLSVCVCVCVCGLVWSMLSPFQPNKVYGTITELTACAGV